MNDLEHNSYYLVLHHNEIKVGKFEKSKMSITGYFWYIDMCLYTHVDKVIEKVNTNKQ